MPAVTKRIPSGKETEEKGHGQRDVPVMRHDKEHAHVRFHKDGDRCEWEKEGD